LKRQERGGPALVVAQRDNAEAPAANGASLVPLSFPHFSTIETETFVEHRAFLTLDWME
jgi:hypothetical protein